jgi:hypothetical protein
MMLLSEEKRMLEDLVRSLLLEKEWEKLNQSAAGLAQPTATGYTSLTGGERGAGLDKNLSVVTLLEQLRRDQARLIDSQSSKVIKRLNFDELRSEILRPSSVSSIVCACCELAWLGWHEQFGPVLTAAAYGHTRVAGVIGTGKEGKTIS